MRSRIPECHLWLNRRDDVPEHLVDDFRTSIGKAPLKFTYDTRPSPEFYAGLEWLVPTAVVLFVFKAYFDGFLQEAGKDHYKLLRAATVGLAKKFLGRRAPKMTVISSGGESRSTDPEYSLVFSVRGEIDERVSACLLLKIDSDEATIEAAIDSFLMFLAAIHGHPIGDVQIRGLQDSIPLGTTLLLAYDADSGQLEVVDPRPRGKGGRDA